MKDQLKSISINWKTTLAGIPVLVKGILLVYQSAYNPDQVQLGLAAICAGLGLIFAQDA